MPVYRLAFGRGRGPTDEDEAGTCSRVFLACTGPAHAASPRRSPASYAEVSTRSYSRCQMPRVSSPGMVFHVKPLKRPARRAALAVHVIASSAWLGLSLGLLALSAAAVTTGSAAVVEASYRSMAVFTNWLMLPVALLTLLSGVLLSLGTPWGLARHRWVWTKFWLTLVTTTLTALSLRPNVNAAAHSVVAGEVLPQGPLRLLAAPIISLTAYIFMTVISILKPWGLTRRGRKHRTATTKRVDGKPIRQTA